MMKFNSIKFEISVLYTLVLGIVLVIFSAVVYLILSSTLHNELDHELQLKAQEINQTIRIYLDIRGEEPPSLLSALQKAITHEGEHLQRWWMIGFERRWSKRVDELNLSEDYINFVSLEGVSLVRTKNMSQDLLDILMKGVNFNQIPDNGSFKDITYHKKTVRVFNSSFNYKGENRLIVQVGISVMPVVQLLQNWLKSIVFSIPVILLLTSFMGRLFASRILSPVQEITDIAHKITYEDLSTRVKSQNFAVEMKNLVDSFNDMISRLEKSFKHIEEFSSYVAHELKTPLTIMRGENEISLMGERTSKEYKRVIHINLEEIARMLKIVEDLLFLTRLDYPPDVFKFDNINASEFFNEIFEQSKILAADKRIHVSLKLPNGLIKIKGDKLHLRRLFFNLIDNAIKYNRPSGTVDIVVKEEFNKLVIAITDSGIGISQEDIPKIFDRFYRGQNKTAGNGLGLWIAQSIVKIHKGTLDVKSKPDQGTTFTVTLPTTPSLSYSPSLSTPLK